MGDLIKQVYSNWPDGANTSAEADEVPPTAFTISRNTYLRSISDGKAIPAKRKGATVLNATPVTGSSAVIGQHEFKRLSGGMFTSSHLVISDNGRIDKVDTAGTLTAINATAFTSSTTQEHLPSFADANNLCFMVNGIEAKKYDGTTLTTFGIVEPSTGPTLTGGVAGLHNGTYEAWVTFYNTSTGHESSAGAKSSQVTVANLKIDWTNIPVSSDSQVDARRLYIRNVGTQANFYFVAQLAGNVATTYTSNIADSSLSVLGPDQDSNDPPPTGVKYLAWHKSRMFAADDTTVYFSPIEDPESFDPDNTEPINPDDSQKITGIISAFNALIVFKSHSMYAIVGDSPDTWEVQLIDPNFGCVAHRSIIFAGNALYWWGQQGPAVWDGGGPPQWLGPNKISRTLDPALLSFSQVEIAKICSIEDKNEHRVIWAVPEIGKTRNTIMFPYSHRLNQWESTGWDPFDVSSLASVEDTNGRPYVIIGTYSGQMFKLWNGDHDGIDLTATYQGTFVAAATTVATITDLTASFPTTGGKYIERKVTVVDSNGIPVDDVRPYITANTGTALTLSATLQGFIVGRTYTYYIGGPALYFTTAWLNQGDPFLKKRYQHCFVTLRATNNAVNVLVDLQADFQVVTTGLSPTVIDIAGGGVWDSSLWDSFLWDAFESDSERFRIGKTGRAIQIRIQHYAPNAGFDILKLGITAETLTDQIG